MTTDVVNLADTSLVDDQIDRLAVILDVQPVTNVFAGTVYRKRLVIQCVGDHKRNQLLREVIWSVVV